MTVLILGAGGQLGQDLLDTFARDGVVGWTRSDLDLTDGPAVRRAIEELRPATVVNAAAWTDVDGCESDPARAHLVNAVGPWSVARACAAVGATLVHVSTDYVFDGEVPAGPGGEPRGLTEFDPVAPLNEYGRSKAAAETLVRETIDTHHIVRTAWVCGARGRNFVTTMLRLARERDHVAVVDDQVGSPTFTRDLAAGIRELVSSGSYGTVNRTNTGRASWYDLAEAVFDLAGLEVDLRRQPSSALRRPAARPSWSVLSTLHADAVGLTPLPDWRDGLRAMLEELGEGSSTRPG